MRMSSVDTGSRILSAAVSAILAAAPALAQAQDGSADVLESVTVTATRRAESVQDVPLNIAAVSGEQIAARGIVNLVDVSRTVPGLFVIDQGGRAPNSIIVRGLNATGITGTESLGNDGGGKVSTYVGEIPLYIDMRPADMERVEVLLGPQGTLYGSGTLGGAIRYIPRRPQFDANTVQLRAEGYGLSHSDGVGARGGFTVNLPIAENLAFRASVDYSDDPGFIDNNFLVRQSGISDPEPDFRNPAAVAANLFSREDVNDEQVLSGRAALRWAFSEQVDANLTYYYQKQEAGGRPMNHRAAFGTGRYEAAQRFVEPNERENYLAALEITADLGFAELTSATGYSEFDELGQRDQTDLLITLEYGYEAFPTFSAFTKDWQDDERFNQELRLVSSDEGPLSWIAGAFYNNYKVYSVSTEYTPEFSEYLGGAIRPDDLEYYAVVDRELTEKALYGEVTYDVTEQWHVTVGARWYEYDLNQLDATDLPLINTAFEGRPPNEIVLDFAQSGQADEGTLFKFNTAYDFTDDLMGYFTISEGYRIGNSNGISLCDANNGGLQNICGQPNEVQYFPDSTTNYEVGLRTQWLDRRLTVNGSVFYIDWKDPQLATSTQIGAAPITINGAGAESKGFDVSVEARLTDALFVSGSYGYVQAQLTDHAPDLIRSIQPPGFGVVFVDAFAGDRLPGSPEHQGNLSVAYTLSAGDNDLTLNYGVSAISDVLTRAGSRGGGEALGGFALHSASAVFKAANWSTAFYVKNLFDKYAETGGRVTPEYVQTVEDENGEPVRVRSYSRDVVRPREIGLRLTYDFGG